MSTVKIFGREPVVITNTIEAVLACLIAFHALDFIGISGTDTLAVVMAVVSTALGVYVAYVTRETLLGALTGFIKAALVLGAVYGFELTAEQTAGVLTVVGFVLALWHRTQTSPAPVASFSTAPTATTVAVDGLAKAVEDGVYRGARTGKRYGGGVSRA